MSEIDFEINGKIEAENINEAIELIETAINNMNARYLKIELNDGSNYGIVKNVTEEV